MPEPRTYRTDVLVVGGGITGLSAALFLAHQGVRPLLVERNPSTTRLPRARAFNPRSIEIFRTLGLEDEIRSRTSRLTDLPEMIGADTLAGDEWFRVDLLAAVRPPEGLSPTDWAMIDQDELEEIVRAAAERQGADIRFATEMVSLDVTDPAETVVEVRDTRTGTAETIRAAYVVAADGNRSTIRQELAVDADGPGVVVDVVNWIVDADLGAASRDRRFLLAYLDQPRPGTTLVPLREVGRWGLSVPYHPEEGEGVGDFSPERCRELTRLAVGLDDLEVALVPPIGELGHLVTRTRIGGWVADRYRCGRVFLAGDAAHVVPPAGSYGANTGIADAHNLAWKLAAVLRDGAGDGLLDTYEDERRPVAELTLQQSIQLQGGRRGDDTGEEAVVANEMSLVLGYRYHSDVVVEGADADPALVGDPITAAGRPGSRAPHLWLWSGDVRRSVLDLFDGTPTLLVGPDGGEWATVASVAASEVGVDLRVVRIGSDLVDPDDRWPAAYGVGRSGASLVRPDGFVAWRATAFDVGSPQELGDALRVALGRAGAPAPA